MVLVAGYQLEGETKSQGKNSLILLPEPFQFTTEDTANDLKRKVYGNIASHFIENEKELRARLDIQFNLSPLKNWLENPLFNQGGISIMGTGGNAGQNPNTSSGFDVHGFFALVERLLSNAFRDDGGIICVLDNLEILNTSQVARQRLESLRDDLFAKHGIRWVVCGARGIVKSVAATSRLQGRLQDPYEISPLRKQSIEDLINSRIKVYAETDTAIPPVGVESFEHAFEILNHNLRDSLKFAGDFSLWLYENDKYLPDKEELFDLFEIWLAEQSESYFKETNIPPRAWKLFDEICSQGGSISPSDYESFDFNSPQNMRGQVAKLETAALVSSEVDDTDHRRKTISVLPKGWLVRHHRSGYERG